MGRCNYIAMSAKIQRGQENRMSGHASTLWLLPLLLFLGFVKQTASFPSQHNPKPAGWIAPAGTIIPLKLENTINSKTAYEGENVYCETIFPVALKNQLLIPAHSYVKGHVTGVDQPGHIIGKAQLSIEMDSLTLPDGRTWPIRCAVYSLAGARLSGEKGNSNHGDTGEVGKVKPATSTEGIIDASGLADATSVTAASEGVGGLVLLLVTRGKRILLRPGTTLEIRLLAPLNFGFQPRSPAKPKIPTLKHRSPSDSPHP